MYKELSMKQFITDVLKVELTPDQLVLVDMYSELQSKPKLQSPHLPIFRDTYKEWRDRDLIPSCKPKVMFNHVADLNNPSL